MNSLKNKSLLFFYFLFALIWLLVALGFISYAFGFFDNYNVSSFLHSRIGVLLFYGMGSMSAVVGFYFVRSFIVLFRRNKSFVQESEFGDINISSYAVKELVYEILKNELELPSFTTTLTQSTDGIHISIKAKVESKSDIGKLGEEVQNVLRKEIHERTGLTVGRVDFYTRGIQSKPETPEKEHEGEVPTEEDSEKVRLEGDNDEY
ncbi:alkaline shock response membrane anchor protein AmaP [Candidatus Bipolaricaulota bacterium]|nr:alkaline shock response membrane anchor protein AmaP [Candidatus Bipolaricaulota bacterium]